ncbi:MAG TPA: hypothetical protein PLY23_09040 [Alphaproteobacteria bacterium]|nr:hypothetical protein [Alphaproteobacteria bacterium]HQS94761.1 hypothetical protein [Alphaproteobacteria bacterium]
MNYSAHEIRHDYQHEYHALLETVVKAFSQMAKLKGQMPSLPPLSADEKLRISGEVDHFTQTYPTLNILNIPDEISYEDTLKQQNLALLSIIDVIMAEKYPLRQNSKKRLFED